jgi:hypothetical protein
MSSGCRSLAWGHARKDYTSQSSSLASADFGGVIFTPLGGRRGPCCAEGVKETHLTAGSYINVRLRGAAISRVPLQAVLRCHSSHSWATLRSCPSCLPMDIRPVHRNDPSAQRPLIALRKASFPPGFQVYGKLQLFGGVHRYKDWPSQHELGSKKGTPGIAVDG